MSSSREQPARLPGDDYILKGKVTVLLDGFEAVCIADTISRAGLNGMEAIDRAREAEDDDDNDDES